MAEEKLPVWRRWWVQTALAGATTVIAWVAQVQLGGALSTPVRLALLVLGALSALLAVLLPLRFARQQEILRISAQETAVIAVEEYRLRTADIFIPLARLVGEITVEGDGNRKALLKTRLTQMAVDLALRSNKAPQGRACFFEYVPGPPRNFVCAIHAGRADGPRGDFVETSDRGRAVLDLVAAKKTRLVPDTSAEYVQGFDPDGADYEAFICAPVVAGSQIFGILTLDSPAAKSLDDNDKREVQLVAMLLAAGLGA